MKLSAELPVGRSAGRSRLSRATSSSFPVTGSYIGPGLSTGLIAFLFLRDHKEGTFCQTVASVRIAGCVTREAAARKCPLRRRSKDYIRNVSLVGSRKMGNSTAPLIAAIKSIAQDWHVACRARRHFSALFSAPDADVVRVSRWYERARERQVRSSASNLHCCAVSR